LWYLGYRSDAEVAALYQRCDALVNASYDEGFGLPAVEAAARGLPIIQRRV
jgi:glycosyltransferase involved in cell wall biosynthesis